VIELFCSKCGIEISQNDKFCLYCGDKNSFYVEVIEELDHSEYDLTDQDPYNSDDKKISIILGTVSVSFVVLSFFTFGFMAFIALVLAIRGLSIAKRNTEKGNRNVNALTLNIIGIVISAIISSIIIVLWLIKVMLY